MTNIIIDNGRLANSFHQRVINIFHKYSLNNFSDFTDRAIDDFDNMALHCLNISSPCNINLYGIIELYREGNTITCRPLTCYFAKGRKAFAKTHHDIDSDYRMFTESRDFVCNHTFKEVQKFIKIFEGVEKFQQSLHDDMFVINDFYPHNVKRGDTITLNIYDLDIEKNVQISGQVDVGSDFEWDDGSDRGPYYKTENLNNEHITFYTVVNSNSAYEWYIHADTNGYYYYTIDQVFLHKAYDDIHSGGTSIIVRSRSCEKAEEVYKILMEITGYYYNCISTYITPISNMHMFKKFDNYLSRLSATQIKKISHYANKHICFFIRFPYSSPQLRE